jgi:hypothetical protein
LQIVILFPAYKCEIQVSQVVIDSATAGEPPGKMPAFFLQKGGAAFRPGILISANHNGVGVLPQIQDDTAGGDPREQMLFQRQIVIRVSLIAEYCKTGMLHGVTSYEPIIKGTGYAVNHFLLLTFCDKVLYLCYEI